MSREPWASSPLKAQSYCATAQRERNRRYAPHNGLAANLSLLAFADPEEVLLLPERVDGLTLVRTSLQSYRRTHVCRDGRPFLPDSRIVKDPGR